MGYVLNVSSNTTGFGAGIFRIRTSMSFRQRNLVPFGATPVIKPQPREEPEEKKTDLSESTRFKVDRLFEAIREKPSIHM